MTRWRTPQLDQSAADALAVLTLYAGGRFDDVDLAAAVLDEAANLGESPASLIEGLVSLLATFLIMFEFDAGIPPADVLQRAGELIAQARMPAQPL